MDEKVDMAKWASYYAHGGLAVIPVPSGKKGPVIPGWTKVATSDPDQVKKWWSEDPDYNIGFVTGPKSGGIFVIDLDVDEDTGADGIGVLRKWESENGALPETWRDISGRGGAHLYFHSDQLIENDNRKLHEDIEIRGNGLNVILPPSLHRNGKRYQWEAGCAPWEIHIAEADETVMKFVTGSKTDKGKKFHLPDRIGRGMRNATLFSASCSLQSLGFPDEVIIQAIETLNQVSCDPPVSDRETRSIINSALKYEKGGAEQWKKTRELMKQEILLDLKNRMNSSG